MLRVYIDGASNPLTKTAAIGILMIEEGNQTQISEPLPLYYDNHEAEFLALHVLLERLVKENKQEQLILCHSDSKILVDSIEKRYTKKENHRMILEKCLELLRNFPQFHLQWVPDKQNKGADQLARRSLYPNKK
ncbi:ribonuclease HI family protein [Jeotgalibaca caeni]|uniref:ribonuclease HI family protein n=1 Tax=Jeotgalibaca caeni TaxID=3028623 RepID=UPI00237DFAF6|nr:ribonuclease HI family protein [Jeotgalibaca caeni]MDE1547876.1 ribonuclease HI family protein [Jeotgalibaca caeni]